ncbi:MAG: hypothetical protein AAFX41_01225 [Bacteroidota bacterium]
MRLAASLAIALLFAACVEPEGEPPELAATPFVSEAEREVYAAALSSLSSMIGEQVGTPTFQMLLGSLTATRLVEVQRDDALPPDLSPLSEQTWSDFVRRNAEPAEIATSLPVPDVLDLVREDTIRSIFADGASDGWRAFRSRYPDATGFAVVSRVGFSPDSTEALVFASFSCGPTCGSGQYVQLQRRGNRWEAVGTSVAWVS